MDIINNIFGSSIIVGGIFPMMFFGFMDFLFRYFSVKIPFQNVFLFTAIGGTIAMSILSYFLFGINSHNYIEIFTKNNYDTIFIGIILGFIWTLAIFSMGFAYEKLKANAAQIIPIASASGLLTSILSIIILGETGNLYYLFASAFIIFMGVLVLQKAKIVSEKKSTNLEIINILPILVGGIIPLISFGVLNTMFKAYYELNSGALGMVMGCTGIFLSLIVQIIRKQKLQFEPKLLVTGIVWAIAVASLGYGFYPLMGQASVLLPIAGASPLVSVVLVAIFLDEKVNWKYIIAGAIFIFLGVTALHKFL